MKKSLLFLLIAMMPVLTLLSSCDDDDIIYLDWEMTNSAPEDIKVADAPGYYPQTRILANRQGGELKMTCTNFNEIFIDGKTNENGEFVSEKCKFTAMKTSSNTISIRFYPADGPEGEAYGSQIDVYSMSGNNKYICNIYIIREY